MSAFDLTGRRAVVTGGSRGIGRGLAIGLAQAGADVAIVFRTAGAAADEVVAEIQALGREARAFQYDLSRPEGLADLAATLWADFGEIDILVNNAGVASLEPFDRVSLDSWNLTFAVNVTAPFFLAQQVAARMIKRGRGGRIINISSTNGYQAEAHLAPYNASKGALEMMTRSLAIELAPHEITVNSVAPGLIETEIGDDFEVADGFWEYLLEHIPLGRLGKPADCSGAVVLLASDAGAYITGQCITVDGGILCEQIPRLKFGAPPSA